MKADRNRSKVEEAFLKQTHAARAEAAAVRREEKRRQEKERILQVCLETSVFVKVRSLSFVNSSILNTNLKY